MKTCPSCGRENPSDRDFCECGEYLRWEPTGFVQAVTPEMASQAAAEAMTPEGPATPPEPEAGAVPPPLAPQVREAAPIRPETPGNGHGDGHDQASGTPVTPGDPLARAATPPPPPVAPPQPAGPRQSAPAPQAAPAPPRRQSATPTPHVSTAVHGAVPPPAAPEAPGLAALTLRLPDDPPVTSGALELGVVPGGRERLLALVRNESGIVDNYDLEVRGAPAGWASVIPGTVYLVPYGSSGNYEQEVEIHLHPPRTPDAEARLWQLELVATSKAHGRVAATAPIVMGIQPYEETATKVAPERASGRRRADFEVAVENKANAPVLVGFAAADADGALDCRFDPPAAEVAPGQTHTTALRVRPPKRMLVGRPVDHRFEVRTLTGDEAAWLLADDGATDENAEGGGRRRPKVPSNMVMGPSVSKPMFRGPSLDIGPGGVRLNKGNVIGPNVRGPQVVNNPLRQRHIDLTSLRVPSRSGGDGPQAPVMPMLPSHGVYRQKALLPWWTPMLLLLLVMIGLALFLFLPKNVEVPEVIGARSAFEAEQEVTEAGLRLAPQIRERVSAEAPPGTVIGQTPAAGERAEEGSEVSLLVAVGNGRAKVPDLAGMVVADAEKALREASLTLGQATPQPLDPAAKIKSHIPAAQELVKEGAPVDIFLVEAKQGGGGGEGAKAGGGGGGGAAVGGAGGGGGGDGGGEPVVIPAIAEQDVKTYAQKLGEDGLVPEKTFVFDEAKRGSLFATDPEPGTEVAAGASVRLLVSAGFPQLAFDDGRDVLLVNGANGRRQPAIAKGPQAEKDVTWSPDGARVAYVAGESVFLLDHADEDASPKRLTSSSRSFRDLAWAPTPERNLLALIRDQDGEGDLCFGVIRGGAMTPRCIDQPNLQLGRTLHWGPDGKSLLVFGTQRGGAVFGMVEYRSEKAFSPDPGDWGKGEFVTEVSEPGKGAIDAAVSPDGERLAVVGNFEGEFQLFLTKADDFELTQARALPVPACKVAWRADSLELVVVQGSCTARAGELVRIPVDDPTTATALNLSGDNPAYQPILPQE